MPHISISPTAVIMDGEDITAMTASYRIEAVQGDVPLVILELKPGVVGSKVVFDGIANIRIASDAPTPSEFLAAIDPAVLSQQVLDGPFDQDPIATAVTLLRELAAQTEA